MGSSCNKMGKFVKSSLRNLTTVVVSILLVFVIIPLLFFLLFPTFIYRQMIIILAKLFKKNTLGKILSTKSSVMGHERMYENPCIKLVTGSLVEGQVDLEYVRRALRITLSSKDPKTREQRYPEMFMNISFWMGYPFWRKLKEVNLDEQISYYNHDPNTKTNQELSKEIVMDLAFKPFSKDKPLWQLIILPNYTPDPAPNITPQDIQEKKYSFIIFAIHHGVADGFSIFELIKRVSTTPEFDMVKPFDYTHKEGMRQRHLCYRIFMSVSLAFKIPWDLSEAIVKGFFSSRNRYSWRDKEVGGEGRKLKNAKDRTPSVMMNRMHAEYLPPFLLSDVKDLKIKHGVSGTAILYAGLVGAARKLFKEGEMPKEMIFFSPLPMPGRSIKLRNDLTGILLLLPMREEDAVKRLRKIDQRFAQTKRSTLPISFAALFSISGGMPRWLNMFAFNLLKRLEVVGVSNVAGPKAQTDMFGYPAKDMFSMAGLPVHSSMLGVVMISQGGQIRVGCGADEKIIKDEEMAKQFGKDFMNELEILRSCSNESGHCDLEIV